MLEQLSAEIQLYIMSYLTKQDNAQLGATCWLFYYLSKDKSLKNLSYAPLDYESKYDYQKITRKFEGRISHYGIGCLELLADKKAVINGGKRNVEVWTIKKGARFERELRGHKSSITALSVFSNNKIASASYDKTIKIWDLKLPEGEECIRTLESNYAGGIHGLKAISDNLLLSGENSLHLWDLNKPIGQESIKIFGDFSFYNAIEVTRDGKIVSAKEKQIKLWDLTQPLGQECVGTLEGHNDSVTSLAILKDRRVVSGSLDKTLKIWDLKNPAGHESVDSLQNRFTIFSIAVLNENQIVTGAQRFTQIWDLRFFAENKALQNIYEPDVVKKVAVTPEGKIVTLSHEMQGGSYLSIHQFPRLAVEQEQMNWLLYDF